MKQIGVLSVLLAAALAGSYVTWTADDGSPQAKDDAITVYSAAEADLTQIGWKSEDLTVSLEKKSDAKGDYTWITVAERKEVTPERKDPHGHDKPEDDHSEDEAGEGDDAEGEDAPADEPPAPDPEPVYETETVSFLGNASAADLWGKFAPLYALRELQTTDPNSAAFGLDEPKATLSVTRRSGAVDLNVGGETYGTKDRYVRYESKVFLLDDATLRPIQFGKTRLVERNLVPLKSSATEAAELITGTTRLSLLHQNKDDPAAAYWAKADTPKDADDAVGTWVDKLFRLRVQGYEDEAISATLEPVFTYAVSGGGESWKVEILRESGAISPEFYAKTEYNRSLVKLTKSVAAEVVADLDTVLGGEDTPAEDE